MKFSHIFYGGDYNPEQWPPEIWQEDAHLMQEAGVNLVSLGVFAWSKLEPAPGRYDFDWLDQIMDLLHAHGVSVNLATATPAPPPWLARLHPEILPVNIDGITLWHGSRRHYCPHSQAYREGAKKLVTHLAQHVRGHPALTLWHIDNEYACHFSECFCETSIQAFRRWLEKRYGSLEALNEAWGTSFWGQCFGAWEEIPGPRRMPASVNPAQGLAWKRFCSDSWLECFNEQKAVLREITPEIPVTTNFMSFFKPLDHWRWAPHEDVISNDSYPDPSDPEWMYRAGMACDLMRSLGNGKPWILMEQSTTHVNWRQRNAAKRSGQMRLGSYQAVGRGANGVMFFQWRASKSGSEKFHGAMLPHAGTDTRIWREVKGLGSELRKLEPLLQSQVQAEVAILFDWENWWALEQGDKPSNDLTLLPQVAAWYDELFRRNITVDFAHPEANLSHYRLIVVPHLYLISETAVQNIRRYVESGGTLLMTFFSGIVDSNDQIRLGGYPAPFRDMLGLWVEEFSPLMEGENDSIESADQHQFKCDFWGEVIHVTDAEVLARFRQDDLAGRPAFTYHRFGKGHAFYLGTRLDKDGLSWLMDCLYARAELQPVLTTPQGIEAIRRTDGKQSWFFLLNHTSQEIGIALPGKGTDLLTGEAIQKSLVLPAKGVAIVQLAEKRDSAQ